MYFPHRDPLYLLQAHIQLMFQHLQHTLRPPSNVAAQHRLTRKKSRKQARGGKRNCQIRFCQLGGSVNQ
jgi:hypothetical protein